MYAIHFYENKTYVLNQALRNIPSIDDNLNDQRAKSQSIEHRGNKRKRLLRIY